MLRLLICIFSILIVPITYAEKVYPVHTGNWYSGELMIKNIDSCSRIFWTYQEKAQNRSAIINQTFAHLPIHTDCNWSPPEFESFSTSIPSDFPNFNISDYQTLISTGSPQPEHWKAVCRRDGDEAGENYIIDQVSHIIFPMYECPVNSRITGDYSTTVPALICSTTPDVCFSDVVGRDLDSSGLGMLGHVGLTSGSNLDAWVDGNFVVEVLNNDKVININTLSSFEHSGSGKYWGEVYGLSDLTFIDLHQASDAVLAGLDQRKFNPSYTLTSHWQEGGLDRGAVLDRTIDQPIIQQTIKRAMFRCDTFVNFCYKKGFNVTIPKSSITLPKTTYESFLNQRSDVPPQLWNRKDIVNEHLITKALDRGAWSELDSTVKKYMNNNSMSRRDKLTKLWQIALQYQNSSQQFGYLMDTISLGQDSFSVIPDFIDTYSHQILLENKTKLISSIVQASSIPISDIQNISLEQKNSIFKAQDFIIKIMNFENQSSLLHEAVISAGIILPITEQNYMLINQAIERLEKITKTKQNFYLLRLNMALANSEMQRKILPDLLNKPKIADELIAFNGDLYTLLKEGDLSNLTSQSKKLLIMYINNQNAYRNSEIPSLSDTKDIINAFYSLANLSNTNQFIKNKFIVSNILKLNSIYQAALISQISNDLLTEIAPKKRIFLQNLFLQEMTKSKDARIYFIYAKAIARLNK